MVVVGGGGNFALVRVVVIITVVTVLTTITVPDFTECHGSSRGAAYVDGVERVRATTRGCVANGKAIPTATSLFNSTSTCVGNRRLGYPGSGADACAVRRSAAAKTVGMSYNDNSARRILTSWLGLHSGGTDSTHLFLSTARGASSCQAGR